jgi:hypothetical protein
MPKARAFAHVSRSEASGHNSVRALNRHHVYRACEGMNQVTDLHPHSSLMGWPFNRRFVRLKVRLGSHEEDPGVWPRLNATRVDGVLNARLYLQPRSQGCTVVDLQQMLSG